MASVIPFSAEFSSDEIYETYRAGLNLAIAEGYRAKHVEKLVNRPTTLPDGEYYDASPQSDRITVLGGRVIGCTTVGPT